jgi:hypothetical protein
VTRPLEEQIAHYAVQTFANYGAETAEAALVGVVMAKLAPLRAYLETHVPCDECDVTDAPPGTPEVPKHCKVCRDAGPGWPCPAARLRAECGWGEGE